VNPDFRDILSAFAAEDVEFMVVGAYALAAHGLPRATGDIDLWVGTAGENLGVAPQRIDVLTSIDGVNFADAWARRLKADIGGLRLPVISRDDLIRNKRACGRPQDLADFAQLEKSKGDR
jgi:hypothetical protein